MRNQCVRLWEMWIHVNCLLGHVGGMGSMREECHECWSDMASRVVVVWDNINDGLLLQ